MPSYEQQARDIMQRAGDEDAQRATAGDVIELANILAERDKLYVALAPFAKVAAGIPPNWPGQCRLRVDARRDSSEYLAYHGEPEAHLGTLPTIEEWRTLLKVAAKSP